MNLLININFNDFKGQFTVKCLEEYNFNVKKRNNSDDPETDSPLKKRKSVASTNESVMETIKKGIASKTRSQKKLDNEEEIFFPTKKNYDSSEDESEKSLSKKVSISGKTNESLMSNSAQKLISLERTEKISDMMMNISLDEVRQKFKQAHKKEEVLEDRKVKYRIQLDAKNSDAEKELQRELKKSSFNEVINLKNK